MLRFDVFDWAMDRKLDSVRKQRRKESTGKCFIGVATVFAFYEMGV